MCSTMLMSFYWQIPIDFSKCEISVLQRDQKVFFMPDDL